LVLFFEYWALGVRKAAIRRRIGRALERYRAAFRAMGEEMRPIASTNGAGVTPDALAAIAVSLITGYAVQAMIDPDRFDTEAYAAATERLIEELVRVEPRTARDAADPADAASAGNVLPARVARRRRT